MPALDGLRAVAVGMVFYVHAFPHHRFAGGLGVDVFFVISGFLITLILLKEYRREGRIRLLQFWGKRAIRLYPAIIVVSVVFALFFVILRGTITVPLLKVSAIALTYTSNIWMTITGEYMGHLTHTWSLAMEEQFYLLWPLLLLLILRVRRPAIIVAALTVLGLTAWVLFGMEQPYNPLVKTGGLLMGCLLAFLVEKRPWQSTPLAYVSIVAFVAALIAEAAGVLTRQWTLPIATIATAFIVLHVAFGRSPIVSILASRVMVHLGVLSYGLYLWHYVVLSALFMMGYPYGLGMATAAAVITYIGAAASFYLIEKPVMRKLRPYVRRRSPAAANDPAQTYR